MRLPGGTKKNAKTSKIRILSVWKKNVFVGRKSDSLFHFSLFAAILNILAFPFFQASNSTRTILHHSSLNLRHCQFSLRPRNTKTPPQTGKRNPWGENVGGWMSSLVGCKKRAPYCNEGVSALKLHNTTSKKMVPVRVRGGNTAVLQRSGRRWARPLVAVRVAAEQFGVEVT